MVQKCPLFVNVHKVSTEGVGGQKCQNLVNVNCERPLALSRAKKAIIHVMKRKLAQVKKKPMEPVMTVDLSLEENIFFVKTLQGSNKSWMQSFTN